MATLTRILDGVDAHGSAASELFLVLFAVRGVALAVHAISEFAAGTRPGRLAAAR